MDITSFDELISAAKAQSTQQQLLLVFTKAELPEDYTEKQSADYAAGAGGVLMPIACVDKRAQDVSSFKILCEEASEFVPDWDIVFAGALSAKVGQTLKGEDIDKKIGTMVESIRLGQINQFATFNRNGEAVNLL